jgi:hypothetical protein
MPSAEPTLYSALAEPAPSGLPRGETAITATKETLDYDQEAEQTIILLEGL